MVEPPGFPVMGFYCGLHSFQRPRQAPDGSLVFDSPSVETHIRRKTSFVAPEITVAAEMAKAPGLVRDRPGAPRSILGTAVLSWLQESRKLTEADAKALAARMVTFEALLPLDGSRSFSVDRNALFRVQAGPGQQRQQ